MIMTFFSALPTSPPLKHPYTPIPLNLIQKLLPLPILITPIPFLPQPQIHPSPPLLRHPHHATHISRDPRIQHPHAQYPSTHMRQLNEQIVVHACERLRRREQRVVRLHVCEDVGNAGEGVEGEKEGG